MSAVRTRTEVTPRAGVWIEIFFLQIWLSVNFVTPRAGVWIEIGTGMVSKRHNPVTPRAGVWIEIILLRILVNTMPSHSPCGSVD